MDYELINRTSGTPPPFVRHLDVTVDGARYESGPKRLAHRFDMEDDTVDFCAMTPPLRCRKPRRGASFKGSFPPLPDPSSGSTSNPPSISGASSNISISSSIPSFDATYGAIDPRLLASGNDVLPNPLQGCAARGQKRRADLQCETEDSGTNCFSMISAKRPRMDAQTPHHSEPTPSQNEMPHTPVPSSSLSSEDILFTMPPSLPNNTPQIKYLPFPENSVATPLRSRKWLSPKTSPLGPRTEQYCRQSRISPTPISMTCNLAKSCLTRNLLVDNTRRNPYFQSPQWCEDMHVLKLQQRLHPAYTCPHEYHPSDPGYDEEWAHETFSDVDWSDEEDALDTPVDQSSDTTVTIVVSEELPRADNSTELLVEARKEWHPPLVVPSQMPRLHPPLLFPRATPEQADVQMKGPCGENHTIRRHVQHFLNLSPTGVHTTS